jgi:hypothetical protein
MPTLSFIANVEEKSINIIKGFYDGTYIPESITVRTMKNTIGHMKGQFVRQIPITGIVRESPSLIQAGGPILSELHNVMALQTLTLGAIAIGFGLVLNKLNKMDKKLDRIIELINEIKKEDLNKKVDNLRANLNVLQNGDKYTLGVNDPDFHRQLELATHDLYILKEYFMRHTKDHVNKDNFNDYMLFLILCYLAQYKIDMHKSQFGLAKENLIQAKELIIEFVPQHLLCFPEFENKISQFNYYKETINGYLFELNYERDIRKGIERKDTVLIELEKDAIIENYKILNKHIN